MLSTILNAFQVADIRKKIAFTAGNARSVNSPAEGKPGISVRDGTMAASPAATQAAIKPAAITREVTAHPSRCTSGSAVRPGPSSPSEVTWPESAAAPGSPTAVLWVRG